MAGMVAFLTVMNLVALYVRIYMQHVGSAFLTFIIYFFNTEAEWNLPAFYSAGALLLAGLLLGFTGCCIRAARLPDHRFWLGLAGLFIYMAFDELCRFHENLNEVVPGILESIGITLPPWFKWAWVLPVGLLVLVIGVIYVGFLKRLARPTRNLFILAGAIYVTGALGMEVVAMVLKRTKEHSVEVLLVSALEEFLEMAGIVVFVHAILAHLGRTLGRVGVVFDGEAAAVGIRID